MARTRNLAEIVGGLLLSTALAGCTVSVAPDAATSVDAEIGADAAAYVTEAMTARGDSQDGVWIEDSIDDLLPGREFSIDGAKQVALAEGIVVGTVTAVEPGRGYMIKGDDAIDGIEIAYDDTRALWRVLVLTVAVDTALGDVASKSLRVGVVIDGSLDPIRAQAGYLSLGRLALVLNAPGKFAFDPSLYSVRQSGDLIGLVSTSGTITFPGLGDESAEFLGDTNTVKEVVAEAADPVAVVEVTTDGAEFARSDD